ncbi:hypothetical protein, conserved [Eimeria praecox]|uniref:Uncharacterized protein n=1 Tax=Eimeria praecox TaxID=51316 RepID=U6H2I3_9EIME|nr:hypothetical protein, conserved [Eimeria praecox]
MPPKGPSKGGGPQLMESTSRSGDVGAPGGPLGGPSGAPELDDAALERLQQQMLEDEEFADDMPEPSIVNKGGGGPKGEGAPEGGPQGCMGIESDNEASSEDNNEEETETETETETEDLKRLKELGYVLQPHEKILSRAPKKSKKEAAAEDMKTETEEEKPIYDEQGLLDKLQELRYDPPPGLRRVPFIETLAIIAEPPVSSSSVGGKETKETVAADEDLKREALL